MITHFQIENILLIEKVNISLLKGLTCIIGETGSGKSILLECIGIALGDRARSSILRDKNKDGVISIEFSINDNPKLVEKFQENGIAFSGSIILRKVIGSNNVNKIFLNDTPVSMSFVNNIRQFLVEVYSQHDYMSVLNEKNHTEILDKMIVDRSLFLNVKNDYNALNNSMQLKLKIEDKLNELKKNIELIHQLKTDIESLNLKTGEEEDLIEKKKIASNQVKIKEKFQDIDSIFLEMNLSSNFFKISKNINKITEMSGSYDASDLLDNIQTLEETYVSVIDKFDSLRSKLDSDINIDDIEARIFEIQKLSRKYGKSSVEFDAMLLSAQFSLDEIEKLEQEVVSLEKLINSQKDIYLKSSLILFEKRKETASKLEVDLKHKLSALRLEQANVRFEFVESGMSEKGSHKAKMLVSMNKGMEMQEIDKVASGGELSRFMLALKVIIANEIGSEVLIFDEIDTGVGGEVAKRIANELRNLSQVTQVLCITHNPLVASAADYHISVSKTHQDLTKTIITPLDTFGACNEIAKMLNGDSFNQEDLSIVKGMILSYRS